MGSKNKPVLSPPKQELENLLLDGQSMRGIGRTYRVSVGTVGKWFDYNKIRRPTRIENLPRIEIDKNILSNYLNEGFLVVNIAKKMHLSRVTIVKAINRHGLKRNNRSISVPITENALEFLDGLLAGDGYYARDSNSTSALTLGTSFHIYAEEVAKELVQHKIPVTIDVFKDEARSTGYNFVARTPKILELRRQRLRWYPEPSGIKRVPRDIKDTPTMWKWFYVGDGTLLDNSRWARDIEIATNAFTKEDVEYLCELLRNRNIQAKCKKHTNPNQYIINIHNASDFIDFIGKQPIKSFEYKWDIPERVIQNCRWCSNNFTIKSYRNVFCSHECRINWQEAPRSYERFNPIRLNLQYIFRDNKLCNYCGKYFIITKFLNRKDKKYCNQTCYEKLRWRRRIKNGC